MKIAAIDIGSNAARLLVVDVNVNKQRQAEFNKLNYMRLPLRLGFEVFETGVISPAKIEKIVTAMQVFKATLDYYDVKVYKACATSAMRDAKNSRQVIDAVNEKTGIPIHVISGDEEANLIHDNHIADNMDKEHGYLYINVGGGSTDLIFYVHGKEAYKKSVDIGTIRILKNMVNEEHWDNLKMLLKAHVKCHLPLVAIGSGGNINNLFNLSKKKKGKPLSLEHLKQYYQELEPLTVEERMHAYDFREDRADVIVPALEIFINVMKWSGIKEVYVPQIGLVNGLVQDLYLEHINAG